MISTDNTLEMVTVPAAIPLCKMTESVAFPNWHCWNLTTRIPGPIMRSDLKQSAVFLTAGMVWMAAFSGSVSSAQTTVVDVGSELVIRTAPVNLPPHGSHNGHAHEGVFPPVGLIEIPVSGYIYGFHYAVTDGDGNEIPDATLHHFNIIDPERRELFLPISRRLLAAGRETGAQSLPWFLMGIPVSRGQLLVVSAMLHNPTDQSYRDVSLEISLQYVPAGRPWPLFSVYPFQIDVAFPAGDKSFDLPPGRFSKSWEGSPGIGGRIIGLGGHLHRFGTRLTLEDATVNELLWTAYPEYSNDGELRSVTSEMMPARLGLSIHPEHTYRVTVFYDNPTGAVIPGGGMGVLAGVIIPDDSSLWPRTDSGDELYRIDRAHYLREVRGPYDVIVETAGHDDHDEHFFPGEDHLPDESEGGGHVH